MYEKQIWIDKLIWIWLQQAQEFERSIMLQTADVTSCSWTSLISFRFVGDVHARHKKIFCFSLDFCWWHNLLLPASTDTTDKFQRNLIICLCMVIFLFSWALLRPAPVAFKCLLQGLGLAVLASKVLCRDYTQHPFHQNIISCTATIAMMKSLRVSRKTRERLITQFATQHFQYSNYLATVFNSWALSSLLGSFSTLQASGIQLTLSMAL